MKKSLALLAVAAILIGTSGCGCCRGLFGKSGASPVYSQCAPSCATGMCSTGSCPADNCGCQSAAPVTYGYHGSEGATMVSPTVTHEAMPAFPTGSGSYGQ